MPDNLAGSPGPIRQTPKTIHLEYLFSCPHEPYQRAHNLSHYPYAHLRSQSRRDLLVRLRANPLGPHSQLLLLHEVLLIPIPRVTLMHIGAYPSLLRAATGGVVEALLAYAGYSVGGAVRAGLAGGAAVLPPVAVAIHAGDLCWAACGGAWGGGQTLRDGATSKSRGWTQSGGAAPRGGGGARRCRCAML